MVDTEMKVAEHIDLPYKSHIRDELVVMGTEDKEAFLKAIADYKGKVIGTHSDGFHCDEVLACSMLMWTNDWKDAMIVRSRDQACLDKLDLLADVGSVYEPEKHRYDHH